MSNIDLSINITTKVRIQVLYDVIKELCNAFNFPDNTITILHKGIVEKQILSCIYAHYMDENDKSVGLVKFNIDWGKYTMYAKTTTGKNIEINSNKPLVEQFALWTSDIIKYVQIMQKELNVKNLDVYFQYRDEIRNDPVAEKEADIFLGLTKASKDIKYNNEKTKSFERKMKFMSEMLPELEIELQSIK